MGMSEVGAGDNVPHDCNVVIEIPMHSDPVKYEVDKSTGTLFVDRFMATAMHYPCNYGYIPNTLSEDGDPIDVLVMSPLPLQHNTVIKVRPIGMLSMEDESGIDYKILAVPIDRLTTLYLNVTSYRDLPEVHINQIAHFFEHYKDLELKKWTRISGWLDTAEAKSEILTGIARHQDSINKN